MDDQRTKSEFEAAACSKLQDLLTRIRAGDPDAIQELWDTYREHLLRVIRRRLANRPALRSLYDSTDFLNSALNEFVLTGVERYCFSSPRALAAFLTKMTLTKLLAADRKYLHAKKRDLSRQQSLERSTLSEADQPHAHEPDPAAQAAAEDSFHHILRSQPEVGRLVLVLWGRGWPVERICAEVELSKRTVYRIVKEVRDQLARVDSQ